jgi:hypothetical protein
MFPLHRLPKENAVKRRIRLLFMLALRLAAMLAPVSLAPLAAWAGPAVTVATAPAASRAQALMAIEPGDDPAHPRLLQVALEELHPTQPAIGYDQVYYKLGRYRADDAAMAATPQPKKFDDWCEANGQKGVVAQSASVAGATLLAPPPSFKCEREVGAKPKDMKTVVIGPHGKVYLTDGHHTFSALHDADGGNNGRLMVWVKVTDNLSALSESAFWQRMQAMRKVWLKDGANRSVAPGALPQHVGLAALGNDPYRALVYFSRDVGYEVPDKGADNPEFLEFYWADWLRSKRVVDLATTNLNQAASYTAAIKQASQAMTALKPDQQVSGGKDARTLGAKNTVDEAKLNKLNDQDGKLRYSIAYKQWLATQPPPRRTRVAGAAG